MYLLCRALLSALAAPLVIACQPAATTPDTPLAGTAASTAAAPVAAASAVPLAGTRWQLVALASGPLAADLAAEFRPHLRFSAADSGRVNGLSGCNLFGGTYTQTAPDALAFGDLLSTRMACPELGLENSFLTAMISVTRYRLAADTLHLYPADAAVPAATFRAR